MPLIASTEYNLDLGAVLTDPVYLQQTTAMATVCITGVPVTKQSFEVQTNAYGIFWLVHNALVTYRGALYLPPNSTTTFSVCPDPSVAQHWILTSQRSYDVTYSPCLAWLSAAADYVAGAFPPPRAARYLADVALCIYQAIVTHTTMYDRATSNEAANHACFLSLPSMPGTAAIFNAYPKLDGQQSTDIQAYVTSLLGVLAYDTGANNPVAPSPPEDACTGDTFWTGSNPVLPNWNLVTYLGNTYTTATTEPCSTMADDAENLLAITAARTVAQEQIAYYFADAPPTHLTHIVAGLLAPKNQAEANIAQLMALVTVALSDAGVYAWTAKFTYWGARPDQYIPGYIPLITTPNFPGYVSGHSTFSAAAAQMVSLALPEDGAFMQHVADVSGISRLYGGIHFASDNTVGLSSGRSVAESIFYAWLAHIKLMEPFIAVN